MKNLKVLFDLDSVIANTPAGFIKKWQEKFPEIPFVPYEKLSTLSLEELYPLEHKDKVAQIWSSQGLFYNLEPLPGAIEAIEAIRNTVKEVAICTAPPKINRYAAQEKYEWVLNNLGEYWAKRLILNHDKTLINGDILIDDKLEILGAQIPSWEHVLYTHPWNLKIKNLRRLTWNNWREVLTELN